MRKYAALAAQFVLLSLLGALSGVATGILVDLSWFDTFASPLAISIFAGVLVLYAVVAENVRSIWRIAGFCAAIMLGYWAAFQLAVVIGLIGASFIGNVDKPKIGNVAIGGVGVSCAIGCGALFMARLILIERAEFRIPIRAARALAIIPGVAGALGFALGPKVQVSLGAFLHYFAWAGAHSVASEFYARCFLVFLLWQMLAAPLAVTVVAAGTKGGTDAGRADGRGGFEYPHKLVV